MGWEVGVGWWFGWVAAAVAAAAAASATGVGIRLPEPAHWLGHAVLFGSPAFALARSGRPPALGLGVGFAAGLAVELAQAAASGRWSGREVGFDLALDAVVAMSGLAATGRRDVAEALGWWLHPAVTIAVAASLVLDDRQQAAAMAAVLAPVVGLWGGRWALGGDPELRDRRDRPALFVVGCVAVAGLAVVCPSPFLLASVPLAVVFTTFTAAGGKPSGHVAAAVWTGVAATSAAPRWAVVFGAAAALLGWARVRSGAHRPSEVVQGAALALVAAGSFATAVS